MKIGSVKYEHILSFAFGFHHSLQNILKATLSLTGETTGPLNTRQIKVSYEAI